MVWDISWRNVNLLSLRWKLGGALLLVVMVSVGIMAFLTNQNTTTQFQQYLQSENSAYAQRLVKNLEQYYAQERNWVGVQEILIASIRSNNDRLMLADNSGKIVADTANQSIGKPATTLGAGNGTLIHESGQVVGILYLSLSSPGAGRGYMGGRGTIGGSGSPTQTNIQTSEGNFLSRINNYIWIAGIISISVALLLGVFLTRQITRPLKSLNTGAKHLSEGDLTYRVKVHSNDEIGRVALSFNNMAVKLENSEQSRRRLVSDVAHELRTPLTIIQGTVDGIKDGVFQPDEEHLDSIREQTVLLTHLVNDLRDLSLAESGQLKLDRQPSDIVDLVQRKITQFEVNARQKNIRLVLQSQPAIPSISIDTRRIEQVLGNLLSNAIRHTPEGGQIQISLKIAGSDLAAEKNSLVVSVSDTGEGIPAEDLPYIFERFYRVETSRSRSQGGAGLGLAIVKQMVQAHGGQVWVESQIGQSSTFYFLLPFDA
jgi:signal transduction histidine kinase